MRKGFHDQLRLGNNLSLPPNLSLVNQRASKLLKGPTF